MDAFTMDTNHNGKHIIYSKSVFYVNVLMLIKKPISTVYVFRFLVKHLTVSQPLIRFNPLCCFMDKKLNILFLSKHLQRVCRKYQ